MKTARKIKPQNAQPNLRERAKAARASATRHTQHELLDPPACQASIIAARIGGLAAEWFEADEKGGSHRGSALILDRRIRTLAEALSYARAASPAGMLGQLCVAFDAVNSAINGREDLRQPAAERAERCLLSVAAALCTLSGIDREGYGASYFMSGRNDFLSCIAPEVAR